jgi:hypothetical protein
VTVYSLEMLLISISVVHKIRTTIVLSCLFCDYNLELWPVPFAQHWNGHHKIFSQHSATTRKSKRTNQSKETSKRTVDFVVIEYKGRFRWGVKAMKT